MSTFLIKTEPILDNTSEYFNPNLVISIKQFKIESCMDKIGSEIKINTGMGVTVFHDARPPDVIANIIDETVH